MKKLKPYITLLTGILCIANLVYLSVIHMEIIELKADVDNVSISVNRISDVPKVTEFQIEDPFNPSPNNLQDILNRIDKAEKNIRSDYYRNR